MSAPTNTDTVTVSAPENAGALVLSWGKPDAIDFLQFIVYADECEPYPEVTWLRVVENEHGEKVVHGVPADMANLVYMARRIFDLEQDVRAFEARVNNFGAALTAIADHLLPPRRRRLPTGV